MQKFNLVQKGVPAKPDAPKNGMLFLKPGKLKVLNQ